MSGLQGIYRILCILGLIAFFGGMAGIPLFLVDPHGSGFVPYAIAFVLGGIALVAFAALQGRETRNQAGRQPALREEPERLESGSQDTPDNSQ